MRTLRRWTVEAKGAAGREEVERWRMWAEDLPEQIRGRRLEEEERKRMRRAEVETDGAAEREERLRRERAEYREWVAEATKAGTLQEVDEGRRRQIWEWEKEVERKRQNWEEEQEAEWRRQREEEEWLAADAELAAASAAYWEEYLEEVMREEE